MSNFSELDIALRNARERGLAIDFDVQVGNGPSISVHDLAEKLGGIVAKNGDILYPGNGGQRSAHLRFDNSKEGFSLSDAYGLDDWQAQRKDFYKLIGLKPGEPLTTYNDEVLQYSRMEDRAKRNAKAHDLWQRSIPIAGTIGATYLRSRGITSDPPEALRFTRAAYHFLERTEFPAMVGLVTDPVTGAPFGGVHLTALAKDGSAKAQIARAKWMHGTIKGGIVRLAEPVKGHIAIAEGIETALSYAQLTGTPTWAAMSARNLGNVELPPDIRRVIIAGDNDHDPRRGRRAAMEARDKLREQDRTRVCDIDWPIIVGRDWNDILVRGYLG